MGKETLFIAFGTQKGGVGKSALTTIAASYFQFVLKKNVAIIDCDSPQWSIYKLREREKEIIQKSDLIKLEVYNQIQLSGKKGYPVIKAEPIDAIGEAYSLLEQSKEDIDIIFFDIAGTLNSEGIIKVVSELDYIFTPMTADRNVMQSTLEYTSFFNDNFISLGKTVNKGFYLFWNQVDGREKTNLYTIYENVISELGMTTLKTFISNTLRFRKELSIDNKRVLRSTIFAPDREYARSANLFIFFDEISNIMKL